MMHFIGLDLAWSPRNRTGGAIIHNNQLIAHTGTLGDNAAIIAFATAQLQADAGAVIAIDAPLRVPNLTGARVCDRALSAEWRAYDAGALPANRQLLMHDGAVRGEVLVAHFSQHFGFRECAPLPHRGQGRYLCEIFPHPAHVSFFGLTKTLKYKAKPGRTPERRRAELQRYQQLLGTLAQADPPLHIDPAVLTQDLAGLKGQSLKAFEDTLDAITCAYTAFYLWHHGPTKTRVYGSLEDGHILTPPLPPRAVNKTKISAKKSVSTHG
jgi:predicted RNase H-like nuclease